ncbi:MAG: PKD domain-containing protein [Dermatophilaceae bacterium]
MAIHNTDRLAAVGPRDPEHGFPMWYEDAAGVRLALGIGPDPMTPVVGELPNPGAPVSFPHNFPDESFYFAAEAAMAVGGTDVVGRARLVLALEAAFGGPGTPDPSARVVFARIRVRIDDVVPGATYVVTHPYGVTDPLEADDRGRVFWTDDRGVADERLDTVVAVGEVAPFLRWTGSLPPGYLGDGITEHTVTGSPFGTNFFRIDGPSVAEGGGPVDPGDPTNPDRIQTDLFTVQGRLATRLGVEVTSATYEREAAGGIHLDVHARSASGQQVELAAPRVSFTTSGPDHVVRAGVASVPATIEVVNVTDVPVTRVTAPVTDRVTVTEATLDVGAGMLTVAAESSDATGPALTAVGLGPVGPAPTAFPAPAAPATVVVESAAGGRSERAVRLTGPDAAPLPLLADAGPDLAAVPGVEVTLDGSSSRGEVTGWSWSQTAGTPVTLTGATTPAATFTAPAPGPLSFDLTVTGAGGPASDGVTVTVGPVPPPDVVQVERAQYRTGRRQFRVDGTLSGAPPAEVAVTYAGTELGRSPVDLTGTWDVRRTLTAAEDHLVPTVGDTITAASATGSDTATVVVRN